MQLAVPGGRAGHHQRVAPYNDDQADGAGVRACLAVGVSPAFMEEGNSGGLRIDGRARALRADRRPVLGLYITSRAVGGLFV